MFPAERSGGSNRPIDMFMKSLASHHNKAKSIAIILSGKGDDGVQGAAAIVNSGGFVIVQTPESCAYSALPEAVIKSGNADFVLPPKDMPFILHEYVNQSGFISNFGKDQGH